MVPHIHGRHGHRHPINNVNNCQQKQQTGPKLMGTIQSAHQSLSLSEEHTKIFFLRQRYQNFHSLSAKHQKPFCGKEHNSLSLAYKITQKSFPWKKHRNLFLVESIKFFPLQKLEKPVPCKEHSMPFH